MWGKSLDKQKYRILIPPRGPFVRTDSGWWGLYGESPGGRFWMGILFFSTQLPIPLTLLLKAWGRGVPLHFIGRILWRRFISSRCEVRGQWRSLNPVVVASVFVVEPVSAASTAWWVLTRPTSDLLFRIGERFESTHSLVKIFKVSLTFMIPFIIYWGARNIVVLERFFWESYPGDRWRLMRLFPESHYCSSQGELWRSFEVHSFPFTVNSSFHICHTFTISFNDRIQSSFSKTNRNTRLN